MRERLKSMTLEQKIGQLFTFYHLSPDYTDFAEKAAADWKAGGIFLDMQCLLEPAQVFTLTSALQQAALKRGSGIPLFVSADYVAGAGCKLAKGGAVHFPKNMAIGAAGDEKLAYESGRITALESLAMGINFNYSPVVDINNNPSNPVIGTHSFGDREGLVSRLGTAVIRGYQEHGMIATAKHFPGHGDTHVDSHLALPVLPFERERLERFELEPFRAAIAAGVDAVMVGHIAVPAFDPTLLPASLSYAMTTELLRGKLGFKGLIVTDGMSMKGVTSQYSQAEACVKALQAGADILLVHAVSIAEGQEMVDAVTQAIHSGVLEEARVDASVGRILATKEKYGFTAESINSMAYDETQFKRPEHQKVADSLARLAMSPRCGFKPVKPDKLRLVWDRQVEHFAEGMIQSGHVRETFRLESYMEIPGLLERLAGETDGEWLLALTHNKPIPVDVLKTIAGFAEERAGSFRLVHFGSPYDLERLPGVPALCMFDRAPCLQQAALDFVLGRGGCSPADDIQEGEASV